MQRSLLIMVGFLLSCLLRAPAIAQADALSQNWQFIPDNKELAQEIVDLPFVWTNHERFKDVKLGSFRKELSDTDFLNRELILSVNRLYPANVITYKIYLNETLLFSYGNFENVPPLDLMQYPPQLLRIAPQTQAFVIRVDVFKNLHSPWPGLYELKLEPLPEASQRRLYEYTLVAFLLGVFVMVVIYHSLLWLLHKEDKESFFIATMAAILIIFTANHHSSLFEPWFTLNVKQFWLIQAGAWFSFFVIFDLFSAALFPDQFPRLKSFVTLLVSVFVWIGCWHDLRFIFLFQLYSWLSLGQLVYFCWCMRKNKDQRHFLYVLAILFLVIGSFGELLVGLGILKIPTIIPYFLMILVLIEVYYISFENNQNREKLETLSKNLQTEVETQTQELRHRLDLELRQANDLLIKSDQLSQLGMLVASVGHEIANPCSSIRVNILEIQTQVQENLAMVSKVFDGDEEARDVGRVLTNQGESVQKILREIQVAEGKISELSDALRRQSRTELVKTEGVALLELIEECLVLVRGRTKLYSIDFKIKEDLRIVCVRSQIGQVILNLLANAADALSMKREHLPKQKAFTFEGKIRVGLEAKEYQSVPGILVTVADNGDGVPPSLREKIFDQFFTTKPAGVGTGIGLAISIRIVKEHKGYLNVGDDPELGGALFELWLPVNVVRPLA